MNEERVTKQIYLSEVNGKVRKGRPRRRFIDQIGDTLKMGQIRSTLNRRACMRKYMDTKIERLRNSVVKKGQNIFLYNTSARRVTFIYIEI
ncbi:unnamed protein product [Parnassius mnemosyne]|uniref:Uncharacterized protein n=1 Tax=Parnassius mnemosyne TaxID=213953 RepID=A0AAV1LDQ7_9NEOP